MSRLRVLRRALQIEVMIDVAIQKRLTLEEEVELERRQHALHSSAHVREPRPRPGHATEPRDCARPGRPCIVTARQARLRVVACRDRWLCADCADYFGLLGLVRWPQRSARVDRASRYREYSALGWIRRDGSEARAGKGPSMVARERIFRCRGRTRQ